MRSGSTLIRLILDAHPQLTCTADTHVTELCAHAGSIGEQASTQTRIADKAIEVLIAELYRDRLTASEATRWADRSIDAATTATAFVRYFPDAQFICLYRHPLDVIDSAVEAFPWGLSEGSLSRFARRTPGNSVVTLAAYWAWSTRAILDFERANPARCHRVHYEELVSDPDRVVGGLFAWLGVTAQPDIVRRALAPSTDPRGGGDHKVWATARIHTTSVGRGRRVPIDRLPAPQRRALTTLCESLGYDALLAPTGPADDTMLAVGAERLTAAVERNLDRLVTLPDHWRAVVGGRPIKISVTSRDPSLAKHWLVMLDQRRISYRPVEPEAGTAWTVTIEPDALLDLLAGRLNLASAVRRGLARITADGSARDTRIRLQITAQLLLAELDERDD